MLLLGLSTNESPRLEVVVELQTGVLEQNPREVRTYDHLPCYLLDLETLAQ
jgi:hypothetical protein